MAGSSPRVVSRRARRFGASAAVAAGVACALLTAAPASALTIVPTFDSTINNDPNAPTIKATISQAIANYAAAFNDPVTVQIKFQEMGSGLGQSNWWYNTYSYSTFRTALGSHAATTNDATALAHLPNVSTNPVTGSTSISVKHANALVLGLNPGSTPDGFSGTISLNTSICNLSRPPGDMSKYDLLAVTEHEIDEILGLASALDGLSNPLPQDLFRYDAAGNRSYTTSTSAVSYFSIDGTNMLVQYNQSSSGDRADWFSTGAHTPRVQDAFGTAGATPNLAEELTALDVIGYTQLVPEPGCAALVATVGCGLVTRRRRDRR